MTYNEGHEDELTVLSMPNLSKGQCRVVPLSEETHPKMRELSSQVNKDILVKLDVIKIQAEQASAPLTEAQRALMSLHECLGHADMATLQQWAKGNKFPSEPASIKNCPLPRCSGCLFAKAQCKSWRSRTEQAGIRATSPTPGSTVHVDQLKVTTPGLIPQLKGKLQHSKYTRATIFINDFSGKDFVYCKDGHQANTGSQGGLRAAFNITTAITDNSTTMNSTNHASKLTKSLPSAE
jgi:hypothetical protein